MREREMKVLPLKCPPGFKGFGREGQKSMGRQLSEGGKEGAFGL